MNPTITDVTTAKAVSLFLSSPCHRYTNTPFPASAITAPVQAQTFNAAGEGVNAEGLSGNVFSSPLFVGVVVSKEAVRLGPAGRGTLLGTGFLHHAQ